MKLELKEGCFGDTVYLNNKEFKEYSTKERKEILKKLIDSIDDNQNEIS